MTLPPLGSVKQCWKCGEIYGQTGKLPMPDTEYNREDDCMERICLKCGFHWQEACWQDPEPGLPDE